MNNLQIFENERFGRVRTIEQNGEPWFIARDVCECLSIGKYRDAVSRLEEDERGSVEMDTPGGRQSLSAVNEYGLYSLVLSSRKPEAKEFKRWITHEVIPAIRKTGGYISGAKEMSDEEIMAKALLIGKRTIEQQQLRIQNLEVTNSKLSVSNTIMRPKADYFDELVDRNLLTNFRETAKQLGIGQKAFVNFLLEKKYVYRDKKGKLMPYAGKGDGLFEVKECYNEKTAWSGVQVLITPKGREVFRLLCGGLNA
nr:MAG TPA: repressor domain protein [Caudoviricetes sp.]